MGCCLWCYRSGCFRGCFSCCMLRITAKWGRHCLSRDTCDCAHRVCGGSGLAAWCSNGSCASSGSLLPGGTLHKKAPDAGGKTAAAHCGGDKGAFKDPGKCRSVLLLWYFFPDGAGAIS